MNNFHDFALLLKNAGNRNFWLVAEIALCIGIFILLKILGNKQSSVTGKALQSVNNLFTVLTRNTYYSYAAIAAYAAVMCLVFSIIQEPIPKDTDEFSYLLAADTFSKGRLSNPPHPLWVFFESFHIFHQPTYMSKYPPGQGMVLAFGQVLFGKPIVGVYINFILAAMATFWMLKAWLPEKWALAGALGVITHGRIFTAWALTFWGGSLAMLGGALIFGALPRIVNNLKVSNAVAFGLGLVILANSRPFEGLVAVVPVIIPLWAWVKQNFQASHRVNFFKNAGLKLLLPLACIIVLLGVWLAYYNYSVSGNPTRMTYSLYGERYEVARPFIFQKASLPPTYNHAVMAAFHATETQLHADRGTIAGMIQAALFKIWYYARFYLGFLFILPFLFFLFSRKHYWDKFALGVIGFEYLFSTFSTYEQPHYWAPIACLLVYVVCRGFMYLRTNSLAQGKNMKLIIVSLVTAFLLHPLLGIGKQIIKSRQYVPYKHTVSKSLLNMGQKHVVIVRYKPNRNPYEQEWVYNEADIDQSPIIWARDLGKKNQILADYYKDRLIWVIEPDINPTQLQEYEAGKAETNKTLRTDSSQF